MAAVRPIKDAAAMGKTADMTKKIVPIKIAKSCHACKDKPWGVGNK